MLHAARCKYRTQKSSEICHLGTIAQICWAICLQLRHVSTIEKNLLSSNISSTCPHNMVNFGPLAAEIRPVVLGTPANFNGFRVLAAVSLNGIQPNCTMFGCLLGWYMTYIFFSQVLAPSRNFARCKIHFAFKSCALVFWQRYCMALQQRASVKLCGVEHRAPRIFGRATITLGIGPHSSSFFLLLLFSSPSLSDGKLDV